MKRKTRFLSLCLFFALFLSVFPMDTVSGASETTYEDVTKYTYELTPILSPFLYAIYVKTENPDPTSFRFVDRDTVYATEDAPEGYYVLQPRHFADVLYENEEIYRVKGGYIFYNGQGMPDGGKLVLQQKTGDGGGTTVIWGGGSDVVMTGEYEDTNVTVNCPKLQSGADYLIKNYTYGLTDFFDKMDTVQSILDELAVYPRSVQDSSRPTGYYPALAASGYYPELGLNEHYELLYKDVDGLLLSFAYPFVLDSLGMPGMMQIVANKLNPTAIVSDGWSHAYIDVTLNGTTKTYGGAGSGGNDVLYTKHVNKWFTFQYDAQDFLKNGTIVSYHHKLASFASLANADAAEQRDLIAGETFRNTIASTGGAWIRIAVEFFFSTGTSYAYALPTPYGYTEILSDAWIDGRYINEYECVEIGATFDAYPTADVVVRQMQYKDYEGESHTQDVLFRYDEDADIWEAESYYNAPYWGKAPNEFYLTRAQVEAMKPDEHTHIVPKTGLIYDGTAYPGTAFENVSVTSVKTEPEVTILLNQRYELKVDVQPADATYKTCSLSSSDSSVVDVDQEYDDAGVIRYYVIGVKKGSAVITVTTNEGNCSDLCVVTVSDEKVWCGCGDGVWGIYDPKTCALTIRGTGELVAPYIDYEFYENGVLYLYGWQYFEKKFGKINSINIERGITKIGYGAFKEFSAFTGDLIIPDSVTEIGEYAFYGCSGLKNVYYSGSAESWFNITVREGNWDLYNAWLTFDYKSPTGPGDVDGDGGISSADARLALRRSVDLETYAEGSPAFLACDVNGDGDVTSADARKILRAAVELEAPDSWVKP